MALGATPNPASVGLAAIKRAAAANHVAWQPIAAIDYHESGLDPNSVGDNGTSFGLAQLHYGGALPRSITPQQAKNPDWNAGFQARAIKALNIQGLSHEQQIAQISRRFERPADPSTEIARATAYYRSNYAGLGAQPQTAAVAPPGGQTQTTAAQPTLQSALPTLQASFGVTQRTNQSALDALGKISGRSVQAAAAPDLASLMPASSQPAGPTHPTHEIPLKGKTPHAAEQDPQIAKIVQLSKAYLGTPYVWGGADPKRGFDCSGLVAFTYGKIGIKLPHNAAAQFQMGKPVSLENLQPGQPVYFRNSEGIHHVGVYAGGPNRSFIQAPHTGDVVKVSSLNDPYYRDQFAGGRDFS